MLKMVEVKNAGLQELIGKPVLLMCANYNYAGILEGVNKTFARLADPVVVYETGPWSDAKWKFAERLPADTWDVKLALMESYGVTAKKGY